MKDEKIRKVLEKDKDVNIKDCFKELKISDHVIKKGKAYAEIITSLLKKPVECIGILNSPIGNEFANDIFLAYDQHVQNSKVRITSDGFDKTSRELKDKNLLPNGIFHSHADFDPFMSPTDEVNFNMVKGALYANNKKKISSERKILATGPFELDYYMNSKKGRFIEAISNDFPPKKMYMEFEEFFKLSDLSLKKIELVESNFLNYAISMVVNCKNSKPYFYLAIQNPKTNEEIFLSNNNDLELKIIKSENKKINKSKLEEELINRVYYKGDLLKNILSKKAVEVKSDFKNDKKSVIEKPDKKEYRFSIEQFNNNVKKYENKLRDIFYSPLNVEKIKSLKELYNSLEDSINEIKTNNIQDKEIYLKKLSRIYDIIHTNKTDTLNLIEKKISKYKGKINQTNNLVEKYSTGAIVFNRENKIRKVENEKEILQNKLSKYNLIYNSLNEIGDKNSKYNS